MGVNYTSYGTPRADLGEAMREYIASATGWIATRVFPIFPVAKKSGTFSAITRETLLARNDTRRVARAAYNRTGLQAEDVTYACVEHGIEGQLDASERELYRSDFDSEVEMVHMLTTRLLREQEIRVASTLMTETTFDHSGIFSHCSTVWSNTAADIIGDVAAAKARGYTLTGMELNALIVGQSVYRNIVRNAAIRGAVQYVQTATWDAVTSAVAAVLGVQHLLVGGGAYNTAPEGATDASPAAIWGSTYALLCYIPQTQSLAEPALGRTFLWAEDAPENVMVESYDEPQTRSTIYRVRQNSDEKLIDKSFGQLIDTTATQ